MPFAPPPSTQAGGTEQDCWGLPSRWVCDSGAMGTFRYHSPHPRRSGNVPGGGGVYHAEDIMESRDHGSIAAAVFCKVTLHDAIPRHSLWCFQAMRKYPNIRQGQLCTTRGSNKKNPTQTLKIIQRDIHQGVYSIRSNRTTRTKIIPGTLNSVRYVF